MQADASSAPPRAIDEIIERCLDGDQAAWNFRTCLISDSRNLCIDHYQDIADRLGLPEGTVKSRINRGRTELARQLQTLREQQDASPRTGVRG
jgi:hypothetical protein